MDMYCSKPMKRVISVLTIMAMLLVILFTGAFSSVFADDSATAELTAPENVKIEYTSYDTCKITWDPVEGANYYSLMVEKPNGETDSKYIPDRALNGGYEEYGGTGYNQMYDPGKYTFKVAAVIDHYDGSPTYGPYSNSVQLTAVKDGVTWKKPAKKGRVYTVKWKKDKTADGYLLEYSFLKSTDLKIESKTYKKTISAKKTSFKLKKMPKKYDIVWIKMKPYIKSGDKKICYDYAQNYEIRKTKIYRR